MRSDWPTVKLGEVLRYVARPVAVIADQIYQEIGIRSFGKGIFHKKTITGLELGNKRVFWVTLGDFVLNIVFAWEGAIGIISEAETGMIGSHRFPTFRAEKRLLDLRFLLSYLSTPEGLNLLDRVSPGGAGRNRTLSRTAFLEQSIPLPPVSEQCRIVARIEELTDEILEAINFRHNAAHDIEELLAAEERQIWPDNLLEEALPLEHLTTFLARGKQSAQGESEHFLIKTQHVQQDHCLPTLLRLAPQAAAKVQPEAFAQEGDILIACSAAGCLGRVARYRADGRTVSTDTHIAIARPDSHVVNSDYLYAYLRGAQGQHQLRSRERGDWQREKVGFRLTELNLSDLRKVPVPVPSRSEQDRIVAELNEIRAEIDTLKRLQIETAAELDALLPSVLDRAFRGEL